MLQSFSGKGGATGSTSDEEATRTHISGCPNEVADALEAKHGVVNEKRNCVNPVIRIGRTGGNKRAHRSGFGDSLFKNLPILGFLVIKEGRHIDCLIELTHIRVDTYLPEKRFHAERASFIRNDGHDQLANLRVAQKFCQQANEDHRGGNLPAFGALIELLEMRVGNRFDRRSTNLALRQVAAQLLAAVLHIANLGAVVYRTIEGRFVQLLVGNRNSETRAEHTELFLVEFFLLVGDVLALARFAESVTLDGFGKNDGWRSLVLDGGLVGRVNLDWVVSAQAHARKLFVREMLHHLEQAWITPKEVLPEVGTALDEEFLILPVRDLAHTADQEAIPVILNEAIPIAAPDDLDDVPSRTPENGFELLNNFAVATHRAVEALQVAVDDEDQVVE